MYGTELKQDGGADQRPAVTETPEGLIAFEARVADDEFIEPKDRKPEAYHRSLIRQISQHARSEIPAPQWDRRLRTAGLDQPVVARGVTGGRLSRHGEHLAHLLSELQFLPRACPDAVW